MRSKGYGSRRVCVCVSVFLCVWVSLKSHLTLEMSLCPENAVKYSAGDEGQNICGVFFENVLLLRSSAPSIDGPWPYIGSAIFPTDNTHAYCSHASSD